MNFQKIFSFLLALILIGETLLLILGMAIITDGTSTWLTGKNIAMLALDGICAMMLFITAAAQTRELKIFVFWSAMALVGISDAYRDVEFLTAVSDPFCFNIPLLVMNNIKLLLVLISFIFQLNSHLFFIRRLDKKSLLE